MHDVFNKKYAEIYDLIYSKKDYLKESDWIERLFLKYSEKRPAKILELGCGTGNYTEIFTRRGYEITAVDISEPMIKIARKKAKLQGLKISFYKKDIKNFSFKGRYNICLMLFNVLGYLRNNSDILDCFRCVRKHLVAGGLFIFDFWFAPAVLHLKPERRVKIIRCDDSTIIKFAFPELLKNLIKINFKIDVVKDEKILDEFSETHTVRFFTLNECESLLKRSVFEILEAVPFLNSGSKLTKNTWNGFIVCKKKQTKI